MDYIREYDLNDYSLGLAFSSSQNPYVGTENSLLAYPYLTSFTHSAFTRDWLLIRGENLGLRVVTDNGWELGLIGRMQTLGFSNVDTEELAGLEERKWALESGPLIGWRGWPVHMQFRSYWELPNRHSGMTNELEFFLPIQFSRGFFVPAVKLAYMDSDYTDYYFSVSAEESTPTRAAYQPGSATNTWAGFTLGYQVAPRWLLKTSIGVEFLDDAITASPIIDREKQWSGSIGLAYNADIFVPRDYEEGLRESAVEIRLGAFSSSVSTRIERDVAGLQQQQSLELENLPGGKDHRTIFEIDVGYRIAYYHQLQLAYFESDRRAMTTLEQDLDIGDRRFDAGSNIETNTETSLFRFSYGYSLMRDGQKELGVKAGFSYLSFDATLTEADSLTEERFRSETPLPTVGVFGTLMLGNHWRLGADVDVFALDFNRYNGLMALLSLDLERTFGDNVSAGFGYNFYSLRLKAKDENLDGEFRLRHQGPKLYISLNF